jgi:choline dehydrogenase-like flavoprotein
MPKIPGGQTGAPTVMIAEKAADIIIHQYASKI